MKRILWIALIQAFVLFAFTAKVNARERHNFYSGVRCLGMGGACIAVTNDETALLVNPAGLGKLRDFYGTIIDPELEFGSETYSFYSESSFSNPFALEDIKAALDAKRGDYYHAKMQVFPSFVGRNFGVGLYGNYLLDAQMSDDGSTIDTFYRNDIAFVLGFNFRFFDGRIKLGFNTKLISRVEVDNPTLSSAGSLSYDNIASEGVGLSTDVGLILAAPWKYIPTITAVVRDVGGTSFDKASGVRLDTAARPNMVKQDLDVAAAIFPIHSNYVRSAWTVEYRGLLTSSDEEDKAKLIHGGLELNFGDVFFARAGYNQRYWTAGLELASEHFQWQFATYGEEVGTADSPKEDRRYNLKFAYRF
ncbi:hypothetical protein QJS83_03195 [Bdellovibrio sp. 22V]|uniref:hypothetical protein n=1 Tax=Bdellovibrio TaxID=958 RepID=UPI0025437288|nr:hypothetical protein [Bdellovibrio sp. 22V]WII72875.1 hypothetical protein QJS83_03195 [Bdellovibrio sp. 22V]